MGTVRVDEPVPGVRVITLDRPHRLNAMSGELISDLHRALDDAGADEEGRVVVLTGAGRGFCDIGVSWLLPRLIGAGRSHELLLTGRVAWSQLEVGSLQAGIDLENRTQIMTTFTRDHREQIPAFVDKRPPHYTNE
jgi:enoyl-CoA hydratase/isomerase-like protein